MNIELGLHAAAAATAVTHNNRDTCWKYQIAGTEYCSYYSAELVESSRLHINNVGDTVHQKPRKLEGITWEIKHRWKQIILKLKSKRKTKNKKKKVYLNWNNKVFWKTKVARMNQ